MRTTLSIDDDILRAARMLAREQHRSLGQALSELARRGLMESSGASSVRNGITLVPVRANTQEATLDEVNALRDDAP